MKGSDRYLGETSFGQTVFPGSDSPNDKSNDCSAMKQWFKNFKISCRGSSIYLVMLVAALLPRLTWLIFTQPVPVSDFWEYRFFAEKLLETGVLGAVGPSAYRLPGYPVFLGLLMLINESNLWLALWSVLLSSAVAPLIMLLIVRCGHSPSTSAIAGLLVALNPAFVFYAPLLGAEHLFVFLLFISLLIPMIIDSPFSRNGILSLALSSSLFGASILVRGEGLFFTPIYAALTIYHFRNLTTPRKLLLLVILLLIPLTIIIGAWYARNYKYVGPGSGLSTTSGLNFYFAHNDRHYGFHWLENTPLGDGGKVRSLQMVVLEGGDEVRINRLGFDAGFQYISNSSWSQLANDLWRATKELYWTPGEYGVFWATKLPRPDPKSPYPSLEISGLEIFYSMTYFSLCLVVGGLLSLLVCWRFTAKAIILFYGIIFFNWFCFAVVFFAKARYRYTAEVALCAITALLLVTLSQLVSERFFASKETKD